jgi:hypothetical protein
MTSDGRTKWRREGEGYSAWMGNGLYAVVRPLVRHEYKRPGRKGRDVRYWLGGVVATGISRGTCPCGASISATVDVRGFGHGSEVRLLAEAKRRALFEAQCVGAAAVSITFDDFGLPYPSMLRGQSLITTEQASRDDSQAKPRAAMLDLDDAAAP